MHNRFKYLFKNTSILVISNFSSKLLTFFMVPLYTNILSTEEYGTYDLIMSTISFFVPVLTLDITDGVFRFMMEQNRKSGEIINIGLRYTCCANLEWLAILCANHILGCWVSLKIYEGYAFSYFLFYTFNQLFRQILRGQEKIADIGIAGVISTIISTSANILFLIVVPFGLKGFFLAYILSEAVSGIYLLLKIKDIFKIPFKTDNALKKEMLTFSLPLIFCSISLLVNNLSDRYIVTWMCGVSENGIYSISYKIPMLITTIQNIFIQAWTVSAIKEYRGRDRNEFYKKTFFLFNALMVCGASILIIMTKPIAAILYAQEFYSAWEYTPFLIISTIFGAMAGYIGPILTAAKNTKLLTVSTLYGAVANFVLNFVLIYFVGVQGAAIATVISNVIIYSVRYGAVRDFLCGKQYNVIRITWILAIVQATVAVLNFCVLIQLLLVIMQFLCNGGILLINIRIKRRTS